MTKSPMHRNTPANTLNATAPGFCCNSFAKTSVKIELSKCSTSSAAAMPNEAHNTVDTANWIST
eukprot:CAMPEP_0180690904 /NCGR_PEP_ID=MMETSP1037_2-20121125/75253_1 /TAXON_ID=632150 /ORGANISM="Azadinium spinosum, Strain 3D9" /LENGTH=63 /DNA_ID=CAMNT_0022721823 /DNA_START=270 /DNA_END=461 /DNA_ORIENTATION=+